MASLLDVPALQGPPDITTMLQLLSEGLEMRRKNREEETKRMLAQNIGGRLGQGDFQGAAETAFASGDLSSGLKIHELGIEGKKQFAEMVQRYITLATPENYPRLRQKLIDITGEDPGEDLETAKADILGEYGDIDTILSEHEKATDNERADAQLDISQQQLQLAKDKAEREATAGPAPSAGFIRNSDGTLAFEPGGPHDPEQIAAEAEARAGAAATKPTERTLRNAQLYKVAEPELKIVKDNFGSLSNFFNQAGSATPYFKNWLVSKGYQRARGSVRTIVATYLYSVSGATANPGEVETQTEILMPVAGDDKDVVADKLQRITTMVESIKNNNDLVAGPPDAPTLDDGTVPQAFLDAGMSEDDWRFVEEEDKDAWR